MAGQCLPTCNLTPPACYVPPIPAHLGTAAHDPSPHRRAYPPARLLGIGLTREADHFKDCDCPLLYLERVAYRDALRSAVSGLESARVVLGKARQRLTGGR
jgi:hypothetical protein